MKIIEIKIRIFSKFKINIEIIILTDHFNEKHNIFQIDI